MGIEIVRGGGGGSNDDAATSNDAENEDGRSARGAREAGMAEAKAICERMLELGVICHATGDHSNVMKVKPPLCFSVSDAECFVDTLEQVLRERRG